MLNGTQVGPYKIEDVQGWIKAGYVKMVDPAWYDGCEDWITVKEIPQINEVTAGHTVGGHLVPPFEAYNGDEPYIFISYAHRDSAEVFKEISQLNDAGYHVWYDEGIEASSEWPEEIANAVIGCSVFLVFISPRSTASVNCRNEINLALNEDKLFLAVHMEESALPPGLRLRMGDLQAILKYKLPGDRYQKKVRDALDQLLGKKKKKIRSRPATAAATTFAKIESNDGVRVTGSRKGRGKKIVKTVATSSVAQSPSVQPSKKKSGLWLGLAIGLVALIGGYSFLSPDGQGEVSVAAFVEGKPWTVPSIELEMNWCEPGVFHMGSPEKEKGRNQDETRHEVTLTQGFFLGKFEVAQEEWKAVMGTSPSKYFGPKRPVENITWDQAKRFCQELSLTEKRAGRLPEGWCYDLPTEAEWEYACRAETDSTFYWGNAIGPSHANYQDAGVGETTPVGQYPSNPWGFYDMLGNVAEFCIDYYQPFSSTAKKNPMILEESKYRVDRGNSFIDKNVNSRIARRLKKNLSYRGKTGFRLCLKVVPSTSKEEKIKNIEPPSIDLNRGLAGWWKFDETKGVVAKDSSGKKRNGELKNFDSDTIQWVKGPVGNALRFDGEDDFVDVGDFEWGGECSFSAWVKYNKFHKWSKVFCFGNKKKNKFLLGNFGSSRSLVFENELTGTKQCLKIQKFWESGSWAHVVCRVHKSGQTEVFKNGKLVESQKNQLASKVLRESQFFGKSNWDDEYFNGEFDDIRIYDRAVTEAEVQALHAMGDVESVWEIPVEGKPWTISSIGLKMIWCKPGTFMAGSPENESGRDASEDQKKISFKKGFFLAKYEVTQKQFRDLMGRNPQSAYKKDDNPVLNVTWDHVLDFCNKVTETERKKGRLPKDWFYYPPSETQWEYACRAGTTTAYSWGKEIDPKFANYKITRPFGPKVVGLYLPNNWGFYDMLGNVQEWCSDSKLRGGSWNSSKYEVRSASRTHHAKFGGTTGFRVSLQKSK